MKWMRCTLFFVFAFFLQGCSLPYLFHVGTGQMRLIEKRQDIEPLIHDPSLEYSKRKKLQLILEIRKYAIEHLQLVANGNFTKFVNLDRDSVAYSLVVCPKDTLKSYTWWFPIVGELSYLGFFNKEYALQVKKEYEDEGYDTYLRGVSAYSTLGWFDDPVFSTMLVYSEASLSNLIIHELTHGTIYKKGATDFNEGVATFTGNVGAIQFLIHKYGKGSTFYQKAIDSQQDDLLFSNFIEQGRKNLGEFYRSNLSFEHKVKGRGKIFDQIKSDFLNMKSKFKTSSYSQFDKMALNNAVMVSFGQYYGDLKIFEKIWIQQNKDLGRVLKILKEAQTKEDPFAYLRGMI